MANDTATQTSATAPKYISRDSYAGKWQRLGIPAGCKSAAVKVSALVRGREAGETLILWESAGHVRGRELFCRTRFVIGTDGRLYGYAATGALTIIHPADRVLGILSNA